MLSWTFTALLLLAVLLVWFWQTSLSVRERANRAAQDACDRAQLQFLDGTVAFSRLQLARNELGHLTLRRTYVFDYTAASIERRQGFVVMVGTRLEHIGFAANEAAAASAVSARESGAAATMPPEAKVLHLEEWRRRKASQSDGSHTRSPPSDSGHDNGW